MKPIKSTDPRKKSVVLALKKVSGADKVTSVQEINWDSFATTFSGTCFRHTGGRNYTNMGKSQVTLVNSFFSSKEKPNGNV